MASNSGVANHCQFLAGGQEKSTKDFGTSLSWRQVEGFIAANYSYRRVLQQIEFFVAWAFITVYVVAGPSTSALLLLRPTRADNISSDFNGGAAMTSTILVFQHVAQLYRRLSVYTRCFAYLIDLINAKNKTRKESEKRSMMIRSDKLHGRSLRARGVPLWAILHHAGCMFGHIFWFTMLYPTSQVGILLLLLSQQATHNTWTKRYSASFRSKNVIVGSLSVLFYVIYYIVQKKSMDIAITCLALSSFYGVLWNVPV